LLSTDPDNFPDLFAPGEEDPTDLFSADPDNFLELLNENRDLPVTETASSSDLSKVTKLAETVDTEVTVEKPEAITEESIEKVVEVKEEVKESTEV